MHQGGDRLRQRPPRLPLLAEGADVEPKVHADGFCRTSIDTASAMSSGCRKDSSGLLGIICRVRRSITPSMTT